MRRTGLLNQGASNRGASTATLSNDRTVARYALAAEDGDVEIAATAGFHVTQLPSHGRRGHRPARVDGVDAQPNIRDSPRETVVDVPLDSQPSRAVGLCELEPKWRLCVRRRGLRLRDNGPCNAIVIIVIAKKSSTLFISDSSRQAFFIPVSPTPSCAE
jgi:hypothetical protein